MQHSRTFSCSATHKMAPPIRGTTQNPNAERRRLGQSTTQIARAYRTTATSAVQVILGIPPLYLQFQREARPFED
ncbi:hypothetical protein AVEN_30825-1 [Araneus ventricosus]|uniref:Uncharacterized protein n=1 Tax=Araneus ventricosus TaxID=182803 RepID=A0A4Y2KLR3_ARAVE|nr:hypothetical protein AVEN_30825-1 [Araneus ventricosus]